MAWHVSGELVIRQGHPCRMTVDGVFVEHRGDLVEVLYLGGRLIFTQFQGVQGVFTGLASISGGLLC